MKKMNGCEREEMTKAGLSRRKTRWTWTKYLPAIIPEILPPASYFLEPINTPGWHWAFRAAFAVCLLSLFAAYGFCRSKDDDDARFRNPPGERNEKE